MEKRFLAYDRQLEHLELRGVAIGDSSAVVDILSRKSYYNIVNGYRRLFLDQSSIGDNRPDFNRILRALKDYRNRCVHGGRLYDYSAAPTHLISQTGFYKKVASIGGSCAADGLGRNDFFALLVAMKIFLHSDEFLQLTREVAGLLGNLQDALKTISIAEVEAAMGLPEHWDDLLIT